MLKTRSTPFWLTTSVWLFCAAHAFGQTDDPAARAAARDLGYEGVKAYQGGDYSTAYDRLSRAYQVLKAPSLGLWLGRTLAQQGKLVEASELFLEVTRLAVSGDKAVQEKAQKEAATEREALQARLAKLTIVVTGPNSQGAKITVDDRDYSSALLGVPSPANPGRHQVAAQATDGTTAKAEVTLTEGKSDSVTLELNAAGADTSTQVAPATPASPATDAATVAPSAAPTTPKAETASAAVTPTTASTSKRPIPNWIGYTALGVGAVGMGAGALFGIQAKQDKNSDPLKSNCSGSGCNPAYRSEVTDYNNKRTLSMVGLYSGGALLAAGAVILLWPSRSTTEKPVAIDVLATRKHQELSVTMKF